MKRALTEDEANAAIDVIVEYCGAKEDDRDVMVAYFTQPVDGHEYRFMGNLGWGGKLYYNCGRLYVGCYGEHSNGARVAAMAVANHHLREILE